MLRRHGSPLTTHIAACAKSALQTALSVVIFRNPVTAANAVGILLTLAGSAMYSLDRFLSIERGKSQEQGQQGRTGVEKVAPSAGPGKAAQPA